MNCSLSAGMQAVKAAGAAAPQIAWEPRRSEFADMGLTENPRTQEKAAGLTPEDGGLRSPEPPRASVIILARVWTWRGALDREGGPMLSGSLPLRESRIAEIVAPRRR